MNLCHSLCVAFCVSLVSLSAHAAQKAAGSAAKADQDVIRQVAKLGLTAPQVRELSAAMKKDRTLGEAVKGAIDQGLRGRELAEFVHNEIKHRHAMMSQGRPMGQGMMGQGQGMGQGMMGQGRGMNGNGMGMGRGMMGGRGMGMGRGMRGGR